MIPNREVILKTLGNMFFDDSVRSGHITLLRNTAIRLCDRVFKDVGQYWFTDHGPVHSDSVLHYAIELARSVEGFVGKFKEHEVLCLACACYLHDLGMAHIPSNYTLKDGWSKDLIDEIRAWHVSSVDELLPQYRSELKDLYEAFPILEHGLPLVCKAHGTKIHVPACDEFRERAKEFPDFRGELLGKILLLADELNLDYRRAKLNDSQAEKFPQEAKAHQYKHYYVMDVVVKSTAVDISFSFPEEMEEGHCSSFVNWINAKLKKQVELVKTGLPGGIREAFDLRIRATRTKPHKQKQIAPSEVVQIAADSAEVEETTKDGKDASKDRPNHFDSDRTKPRSQGVLYPVMDRLMDELFRELNTDLTRDFFEDIYISIPENKLVSTELLHRISKYASRVRGHRGRRKLSAEQLFLIAGRTGCGKSALIRRLESKNQLRTRLPAKNHPGCLFIHINCLPLRSFQEVLRKTLSVLADECRRSQLIWQSLKAANWIERLQYSRISTMPDYTLISVLRGVLHCLHLRLPSKLCKAVPVVCILDNVDRMIDFGLKKEVIEFARRETIKGYPFFVVTLRNTTKHIIDESNDEFADIATHDVRAPSHIAVLSKRLEVAFSKEVLIHAHSWCQRQEVDSILGNANMKFADLRRSLRFAMMTLTGKQHYARRFRNPLIPGMCGTNMRNALTLYRAIMKSVDMKVMLTLSQGSDVGEHYLVRTAALERHPCYFASRSRIQNVFDTGYDGFHFAKLYLLKIFEWLAGGLSGGEYVALDKWINKAEENGLPQSVIKKEIWDMISGKLAYIEAESFEDGLPERYHYLDDLPEKLKIRLSSCGKYYLKWLIHDISYLDCVVQDTLMDSKLARKLATMRSEKPRGVSGEIDRVYKFLAYLEGQENSERASWGGTRVIPIVPEIRRRVDKQKAALIYL